MPADPETTAPKRDSAVETAYGVFVSAIEAARPAVFESRKGLDPIDVADGEAYLGTLIEGATQFARVDPDRPVFAPWATPHRRWVDNGWDSAYWMAPVAGGRRYRIRGRLGDECYLSFTLYAGNPGHPEKTVRNWNFRELGATRAGDAYAFEVEPPDDACYVISRQYFLDPRRQRAGEFEIERLASADRSPLPAPPSAASAISAAPSPSGLPPAAGAAFLASRWRAAASFLRAMTSGPSGGGGNVRMPAYVSVVPNVMGDPSQWRESEGGGRGTPDQVYAMGPYRLEADEMLELRLRWPKAVYCSVAVWNRFSQTVDPRIHRSTLNAAQSVPEADGSVRILLAHRDPGHPNWLDAGGRRAGQLFWRFLLTDAPPGRIEAKVVQLESARSTRSLRR